jgi:hypothetical protein
MTPRELEVVVRGAVGAELPTIRLNSATVTPYGAEWLVNVSVGQGAQTVQFRRSSRPVRLVKSSGCAS